MDSKIIDFYELLNIHVTATETQIKKSFKKKVLHCHPDKNPNNPNAAALFRELYNAYQTLINPKAREIYDKKLNAYKAEQLRQEQLRREKLRQEELRQEKIRQERLRQEKIRKEKLRQEKFRQEQLRKEQLRQEQLRQEQLRQERFRQEQLLRNCLRILKFTCIGGTLVIVIYKVSHGFIKSYKGVEVTGWKEWQLILSSSPPIYSLVPQSTIKWSPLDEIKNYSPVDGTNILYMYSLLCPIEFTKKIVPFSKYRSLKFFKNIFLSIAYNLYMYFIPNLYKFKNRISVNHGNLLNF